MMLAGRIVDVNLSLNPLLEKLQKALVSSRATGAADVLVPPPAYALNLGIVSIYPPCGYISVPTLTKSVLCSGSSCSIAQGITEFPL